jgi:hypothetical protein
MLFAHGNVTSRNVGSAYSLGYDAENRLTGVTTLYVGDHYEKNLSSGVVTKYYYAGGWRVALRDNQGVKFLHADHPSASSGQAWGARC